MPRHYVQVKCGRFFVIVFSCAATWSTAFAQQRSDISAIVPVESWTNVFAGKEPNATHDVDVRFRIRGRVPTNGRVAWSLYVDNAAIQRQEIALGPKTETVKITLRLPYVREGVVMDGKLVVALIGEGQPIAAATLSKPLHIYPYQPFYQRTQWLKNLNIMLYDPGAHTGRCLRDLAVPFNEVRDAAALAGLKSGLLIIGEGAALEEERELPALLNMLAAKGLPVLCLAPKSGSMPIPEAKAAAPLSPMHLIFANAEIIRRFDKRLDSDGWANSGTVIASAMALKAGDGAVVAEVSDGSTGWPWLEISYPAAGRLVICGFSLVDHWDAGPTPRFLFARILESMMDGKK